MSVYNLNKNKSIIILLKYKIKWHVNIIKVKNVILFLHICSF